MYKVPPQVEYERDIKRLTDYYKDAYKQIVAALLEIQNNSPTDDIYQRQASLLRQIEVILTELNSKNKAWCDEMLRQAFSDGQALAILTSGGATTLAEAAAGVQFSMLAQQTVEAAINSTYNHLLSATQNTERRVKQIVRQTVGDIIRQRTLQQYGRNTIKKDIVQQLTKKGLSKKVTEEGFIGIIDAKGRKWSLDRYAEMVTRTELNNAHVEGVKVSGIERGIDTALISTHNAPDACGQFEGMIISLNGLTEGLLTYDELRNTNLIWHPNCKHKVHLVKLELLPKTVIDKHYRKVQALKSPKLRNKVKPLDKLKTPSKEDVQGFNSQLSFNL